MKLKVKRPERELRNAIIALLRAHGIPAWPTGVGAFPATYQGTRRFVRMGTKGMSDIIGCVPSRAPAVCAVGTMLAIEVKSPTGTVRPEQTAFLAEVVRAGGIGFVARSCEDVVNKLALR